MDISEKYLLLLLQVIKGNGDITVIVEAGYDYSQIVRMINHAKNNGYIDSEKGKLIVSEKGVAYINEVNKKLKRQHADAWISPLYSMQREDMLKDSTYLPKRKKIKKLF